MGDSNLLSLDLVLGVLDEHEVNRSLDQLPVCGSHVVFSLLSFLNFLEVLQDLPLNLSHIVTYRLVAAINISEIVYDKLFNLFDDRDNSC